MSLGVAPRLGALRRQSDFVRLRETGQRRRSGPITITFCLEGTEAAVAYAIPKRVGNAVVRNRVRRRIREVLRANHSLAPGIYLVSVAPQAATMKYQELAEVIGTALEGVTKGEVL